ncbi:MAG: ribose 5-phosphate isomerase B [Candidatus Marinimicrobia bacterium]|nr:ribose 5-phosphate isomerase B [Candidatus Neomarinimicrobiota bacterium]
MDKKNSKNKIEKINKIYFGADHAGYEAKQFALDYCKENFDIVVEDLGTSSEESVDYSDIAFKVACEVANNNNSFGILFCGTGIGMSIASNKVRNIRTALCTTEFHAEMARKHNDANILAMGGRVSTKDEISKMIDKWFETKFEGGRHKRRIDKIEKYSEC